jgi:glucose-6-phosphate-specific signal transduction histidine kinase
MVALWATAFTMADVGPVDALMTGAVLGLLVIVVWGSYGLVVDRVLPGRRTRTRFVIVCIAIPAAAISWVAAGEALEQLSGLMLPTAETPVRRVAQALILTLFPIAQLLTRALRRRGEASIATMKTYNDQLADEVARANTELWMQRRALARKLHGSIQATVDAAALRLSSAERNGSSPDGALARARTDIECALVGLGEAIAQGHWDDPDDLDRAITRIRGLWEGVADIDVALAQDVIDLLRTDLATRATLVDVLTESCSNAVRHGNATRICARVTHADDLMLLEVVDNGSTDAVGLAGMGSAMLDEITVHWQRTRTAAGTRLSAVLPRS